METRILFKKKLSYRQLTFTLYHRIHCFLTDRIVNQNVVSEFSLYLTVIKTQLFVNVLKGAFARFVPL